MSLAIVYTRASLGIESPLVTVEVHLSNGLPSLSIVGLPETAVKESKERVRSALINSHFEFPARRITINLAPADLPKEGGRYDLAIALGVLAASEQLPSELLDQYEFVGELALTGELRSVNGALPAAIAGQIAQRKIVVPQSNAQEASLQKKAEIFPAKHLLEVCAHLNGTQPIPRYQNIPFVNKTSYPDMDEVLGQAQARRALEIAAAGRHNLLMVGSPGTGKTMLAERLPGILPPLSEEEAIEVATVQSIANFDKQATELNLRPFRSPHHSASPAALVGGGGNPKPGEISMAHLGVLFLDELPEFQRKVLEVLREPLERGDITIARASHRIRYPAQFQLIAAMNPCPCGYHGISSRRCRCSPNQIIRYRDKISGPLLDRLDLHVNATPLPARQLIDKSKTAESSDKILSRVVRANELQRARQQKANAQLSNRETALHCKISNEDNEYLSNAIADLSERKVIERPHIQEALGYRLFDRGI